MLRQFAGWGLLLLLVGAPWAVGCLDDWAKMTLAVVALAASGCWAVGHLVERRWPRVPWPCAAAVGGLSVFGWGMALNAHLRYVADSHTFVGVAAWWPAGPGAVDGFSAREVMWPLSGVLGMLLVACDMGRERIWRRRIWWVMAATGTSVALYGILGKLGAVPVMGAPAGHSAAALASAFATFDYHGNAAAFLNLVMPLAFGMLLRARRERWSLGWQAACAAMWVICMGAIFVNISRAGVLITELELAALAGWTGYLYWQRRKRTEGARTKVWIAGCACVVFALAGVIVWGHNVRGTAIRENVMLGRHSPRALAWKIAWAISTDSPWTGSGPGSFKLLFPRSKHWIPELYSKWIVTDHVPGKRVSEWSYAYEDYLQTLVEWGWIGGAIWGALIIGAGGQWLRAMRSGDADVADYRNALFIIGIALGGVYIHAFVDYPLQVVSIQLYAAVLLGLVWSSAAGKRTWD